MCTVELVCVCVYTLLFIYCLPESLCELILLSHILSLSDTIALGFQSCGKLMKSEIPAQVASVCDIPGIRLKILEIIKG